MKGCFITALVILTILIASVIYVFKFHSDDVVSIVKPVLIKTVKSDVDTKIKALHESIFTDSLKAIVQKYTRNLEQSHTINLSDAQFFYGMVKDMVHDGSVDSLELRELNILLKKQSKK